MYLHRFAVCRSLIVVVMNAIEGWLVRMSLAERGTVQAGRRPLNLDVRHSEQKRRENSTLLQRGGPAL